MRIIEKLKSMAMPARLPRPEARRDLNVHEEQFIIKYGGCPYCHHQLFAGPSGGMSTNYLCRHMGCNARFNLCFITPLGPLFGSEFSGTFIDTRNIFSPTRTLRAMLEEARL